MLSKETIEERAYLDTLQLFAQLPAEICENLLCQVAEREPNLIKYLAKKENFNISGFRVKAVPNQANLRKKICEALLKPEFKDVLHDTLTIYFQSSNNKFHSAFHNELPERSSKPSEEIATTLNNLSERWSDDPLFKLYQTSQPWIFSDILSSIHQRIEWTIDKMVEEIDNIEGNLNKHLEGLRSFQTCDKEAALECFEKFFNASNDIHNHVKSIATKNNLDISEWSSKEEFNQEFSRILNLANNKKAIEACDFFEDLLASLKSVTVLHRSSTKKKTIQEMVEASCKEIEQAIAEKTEKKPEGAETSAHDWLKWLFTLEGDDLVCIQKEISTFSQKLAELTEESWDSFQFEGAIKQPTPSNTDTSPPIISKEEVPKKSFHPDTKPKITLGDKPDSKEESSKESSVKTPILLKRSEPTIDSDSTITPTDEKEKISNSLPANENQTPKDPDSAGDHQASVLKCLGNILCHQRYGLSYHFINAIKNADDNYKLKLGSPSLYKALALSQWIFGSQSKEAIHEYTDALHGFSKERLGQDTADTTKIIFAATLQPGFTVPYITGATKIFRNLNIPGEIELNELKNYIVDLLDRDISPDTLHKNPKDLKWSKANEDIRAECEKFLNAKHSGSTNYSKATSVLKTWFSEKHRLGKAFLSIINESQENFGVLKEIIKDWGERGKINQQIDNTTKDLFKGKHFKVRIEGNARKVLIREAISAVDLLSKWVEQNTEPTIPNSIGIKEIDSINGKLQKLLENAIDRLPKFKNETSAVDCAQVILKAQLQKFQSFMSSERQPPLFIKSQQILGRDLLHFQNIHIDSDFCIQNSDLKEVANDILNNFDNKLKTLDELFEDRAALGDHDATQLIIELMQIDEPRKDISHFKEKEKQSIKRSQKDFSALLSGLRNKKNQCLSEGLFNEDEFNKMEIDIEGYNPEKIRNFKIPKTHLRSLEKTVKEKRKKKLDDRRGQIEKESFSDDAKNKIKTLLNSGDLLLANEYYEYCENNEGKLPLSGDLQKLPVETFKQSLEQLSKERMFNTRKAKKHISKGSVYGPFNFSNVRGSQQKTAIELLDAWDNLKDTSSTALQENLESLFQHLNFSTPGTDISINELKTVSQQRFEAKLQVSPITDRSKCPIPEYGSKAEGHYKILGFWGRPTEDEVLGATAPFNRQAVIVLWFGQFSLSQRQGAISECRRRNLTTIIIDELSIIYACTARQSRLPFLLKILLPYTVAHPYSEVSSLVPQEMFFGREDEIRRILDPLGGNLVYGGRQLGKTALLREIERTYNRPKDGTFVKYADLKHPYGIGESTSIEGIWKVISDLLSKDRIVKSNTIKSTEVKEAIIDWLDKNPNNKIIILLDEADNFLLKDDDPKNSFCQISHFKDLMDRTNRKFKVVFAGLHNVQRTSQKGNQSLAHFGSPISIGPLIENHGQAAINMVRYPFEALGFKFESHDVILRILAYTNYYPCLIQLFCRYLLHHLSDSSTVPGHHSCPPYIIDKEIIDGLYQNKQRLREDIVDRFRWTLQLDLRYQVIGLIIAMKATERLSQGLPPKGITISEICQEAEPYWPKSPRGAPSLSRVLYVVKEMCELGVLQALKGDRFGLRNPNLLRLLGSRDTMEEELREVSEMELPELDPEFFRRDIEYDNKISVPSVFTKLQESMIFNPRSHGIIFLSAPPISGTSNISRSLKATAKEFGSAYAYKDVDAHTEISSFSNWLKGLDSIIKKSKNGPIHTFLITPQSQWNHNCVEQCFEMLKHKKSSQRRFLRFVFCTDPKQIPILSQNLSHWKKDHIECLLMAIEPWPKNTVRSWSESEHIKAAHNCDIQRLNQATGYWGHLLLDIGQRVENGLLWNEAIKKTYSEMFKEPIMDYWFSVPIEFQNIVQGMIDFNDPLAEDEFEIIDYVKSSPDPIDLTHRFLEWGVFCYYLKKSEDKYALQMPLPKLVKDSKLH